MTLMRFMKTTMVLTVLALIYINLQMQIFDLAYQGKKKDKEVRRLLDENGNIMYGILTLKSANNLGDKLLSENSEMQFVDSNDIIKLQTRPLRAQRKNLAPKKAEKKQNVLISLFSLKSQAEAKPAD